jgi:hypothetical protein
MPKRTPKKRLKKGLTSRSQGAKNEGDLKNVLHISETLMSPKAKPDRLLNVPRLGVGSNKEKSHETGIDRDAYC